MSKEMKHEIIFGDQKRFDEQNNEMTEVMLWHDCLGPNFVSIKELSRMNLEGAIPHGSVVLAMRRIIADPKRWTVEDQKAGRLPEVGCMVMVTSVDECASVAAINNDAVCVVFHDGEFTTLHKSGISPIETPEEKAERLRSEWINEAINAVRKTDVDGYETIYDALLSGELPVPTKGGE